MMTKPERHVYLSAADRQLETYLAAGAFERSLLLNVLFQPGVLIPDIFFFISSGLSKHLSTSRLSLLEAGLQTGDIVPSFRQKDCTRFSRALEIVRGGGDRRSAILGIRPDAEKTARRLDVSIDRCRLFSPAYWPEWNVAQQYERLVREFLVTDDPPELPPDCGIPQERMVELWRSTRPWRIDCVNDSVTHSATFSGSELRRGSLMTSLGQNLGLIDAGSEINDVAELFGATVSPEKQYALHFFCRWITDIYQYNQALALEATPSFPEYDALEGAMVPLVLRAGRASDTESSAREAVRVQAPMPRPSSLLRIPPLDLLAIKVG